MNETLKQKAFSWAANLMWCIDIVSWALIKKDQGMMFKILSTKVIIL